VIHIKKKNKKLFQTPGKTKGSCICRKIKGKEKEVAYWR